MDEKEKPFKEAQKAGFDNLKHLSELSGESVQTLISWFHNNPQRFHNVLAGAKRHLPPLTDKVVLTYDECKNTPLERLFR